MDMRLDQPNLAAALRASAAALHANNDAAVLTVLAKSQPQVRVTRDGALLANTGRFTGRSPGDKFIVDDQTTHDTVWWSNTNRMESAAFDRLRDDMIAYAAGKPLFEQQLVAGADPAQRLEVDILTESAWHALFIRNLLIRPSRAQLASFDADVTVLHMPGFDADPSRHGTRSTTAIALDFSRNIILICGTAYAGEIKKAVFSLFNFHAPDRGVLPMHCSANVGAYGDTALFFGLSGTGKTTLSTAPDRALIGDDEHGWNAEGVFNLEGGCYAKAANLSAETEPEIFATASLPGSVLENVSYDEASGRLDFADLSRTENTRIAYPLTAISNRVDSGRAGTPTKIVLLTADAFGVLPPIARLTRDQAIYYFLSGYTAKVAGTERGITEPVATFSACFGAPFMAWPPTAYGQLLAARLAASGAECWLLNTGWTGGPYGVGTRMKLGITRRLLAAALSGELSGGLFRRDALFDLDVPVAVDGVEPKLLDPAATWSDPAAYASQAEKLLALFARNFEKLGPEAAVLTHSVERAA